MIVGFVVSWEFDCVFLFINVVDCFGLLLVYVFFEYI